MTTKTALTLDEFLALPETKPASEYSYGEVTRKPMPTGWHSIIQQMLSLLVGGFVVERQLGGCGPEWRCVFPGRRRALVPGWVFIRGDRLPLEPDDLHGPFRGSPDLVVEVLSPGDRPGRVAGRIVFYLVSGVRLVWLLDPKRRTVTVFAPGAEDIELRADDELDGGDVLPGLRVPVASLFRAPTTNALGG